MLMQDDRGFGAVWQFGKRTPAISIYMPISIDFLHHVNGKAECVAVGFAFRMRNFTSVSFQAESSVSVRMYFFQKANHWVPEVLIQVSAYHHGFSPELGQWGNPEEFIEFCEARLCLLPIVHAIVLPCETHALQIVQKVGSVLCFPFHTDSVNGEGELLNAPTTVGTVGLYLLPLTCQVLSISISLLKLSNFSFNIFPLSPPIKTEEKPMYWQAMNHL